MSSLSLTLSLWLQDLLSCISELYVGWVFMGGWRWRWWWWWVDDDDDNDDDDDAGDGDDDDVDGDVLWGDVCQNVRSRRLSGSEMLGKNSRWIFQDQGILFKTCMYMVQDLYVYSSWPVCKWFKTYGRLWINGNALPDESVLRMTYSLWPMTCPPISMSSFINYPVRNK